MAETEGGGFPRPIALAELSPAGITLSLRANPTERRALALRFAILELAALEGELRVRSNFGGEVEVVGRFTATVEQTCVVSLEPFASRLEERFMLRFARGAPEPENDRVWSRGDEEPPEPIVGETLDLGEILAQQLALAIDPFPRRPGADFDRRLLAAGEERDSPFSVLGGLKGKRAE